MNDSYVFNVILLIFSILVFCYNLKVSNIHGSYWWCNPNGFLSVPMFLSSTGFSLFYIWYGHYPVLYGVNDENIELVNFILVFSFALYTLGTRINLKISKSLFFIQDFDLIQYEIFEKLLGTLTVLLCIVVFLTSYYTGALDASEMKYGEGQWLRVNDSPLMRLSVLLVPLFASYVVTYVLHRQKFPWLFYVFLTCVIGYLGAKGGGRKDMLFSALIFISAYSIYSKKNKALPLVLFCITLASINYLQVSIRETFGSGQTVGISSLPTEIKDENTLIGQVSTIMPISPTISSAMMAFPSLQDFSLGSTYVESMIGTILPKRLTQEFGIKSPNESFHDLYYPEVEDFSMDYSLSAEGYQNFGIAGVFVAYFFMGFFINIMFRMFISYRNSIISAFYFPVLFSTIWGIRSDSNTFLKTIFYPIVVLFLLYIASCYLKNCMNNKSVNLRRG